MAGLQLEVVDFDNVNSHVLVDVETGTIIDAHVRIVHRSLLDDEMSDSEVADAAITGGIPVYASVNDVNLDNAIFS